MNWRRTASSSMPLPTWIRCINVMIVRGNLILSLQKTAFLLGSQEALDWRKWTKVGCSFLLYPRSFDRAVIGAAHQNVRCALSTGPGRGPSLRAMTRTAFCTSKFASVTAFRSGRRAGPGREKNYYNGGYARDCYLDQA